MGAGCGDGNVDYRVYLHVLQNFQAATLFRHRSSLTGAFLPNRAEQPRGDKHHIVAPSTALRRTRTPVLRHVLAILFV